MGPATSGHEALQGKEGETGFMLGRCVSDFCASSWRLAGTVNVISTRRLRRKVMMSKR